MLKNCRVRLRLVTFLVCWRVCAGEDDLVVPETQIPLNREADDGAVTLLNRSRVPTFLEDELRYKVDEFRANYDLTGSQQAKLSLACRADIRRASNHIHQVHHAAAFREQSKKLFGPDSFMAKSLPRILNEQQSSKYQADVDQRLRILHRSNIEGAIREIERYVVLQIPQQEALVELLLCELPQPNVEGNLDSLVVKYQFSQLSEQSLKSVFDEDQWPQVRNVLDGYHKFTPLLKQHGLIDNEVASTATRASSVEDRRSPPAREQKTLDPSRDTKTPSGLE